MAQFFQIHPEDPQERLITQAVDIIKQNSVVIVYPTDSAYALGCRLGDKQALEKIRRIRQLKDKHPMTLMCRDLSELGVYAKVENNSFFRAIKANTPGAYTFLLKATKEVPKRLLHPKRKIIGIRIPENKIVLALLEALGEPIMSTSLIMPGEEEPLNEAWDIRERLENHVDLIIDGGYCGFDPTSIIDLYNDSPQIIRVGRGDVSPFEAL